MAAMYLRSRTRTKNGKRHRYWSVVETHRLANGRTAQRQVLYLGEINDQQEAAWRTGLSVFDETRGEYCQLSLFPQGQPVPADAVNALRVDLRQMRLCRPRRFGDVWLALTLWRAVGLDRFWAERLGDERGAVDWAQVLAVLTINRLCAPASEWAVHRRWFLETALADLLGVDFAVVAKDRLYRCLDRILPHKDALFQFLAERWKTLFNATYDVLLYDLTSTYFEGQCASTPKARHGYSRDGRPDCRQVVIALVVTADGFPLTYEVLAGNTSDRTTLRDFLEKVERLYGTARRVWLMDRGVPTEQDLTRMRAEGIGYLVGTPKALLDRLAQALVDQPWAAVHPGMQVKMVEEDGDLYVLAQSEDRRKKERAIRRRKLKALVHGLNRLKRTCHDRDRLLGRIAVLRQAAGRVARFVRIRTPTADEPVTRQTFQCTVDRAAWRRADERDGSYILRAHLPWAAWPTEAERQAPALWAWYMQLVEVEAAFRTLKSDLDLRPIYHQMERRVEAHILVAFLGYCLTVTLKAMVRPQTPGLTPREVLATMAGIQMVDVEFPTADGRVLTMPRHTEPTAEQAMVLSTLGLTLPAQPPPRIRSEQVPPPKEAQTPD